MRCACVGIQQTLEWNGCHTCRDADLNIFLEWSLIFSQSYVYVYVYVYVYMSRNSLMRYKSVTAGQKNNIQIIPLKSSLLESFDTTFLGFTHYKRFQSLENEENIECFQKSGVDVRQV